MMTRNEAIKQLEEAIGYIALPRQRLLAKDALRVLTRLSKGSRLEEKVAKG